jgi:hypothetical protein
MFCQYPGEQQIHCGSSIDIKLDAGFELKETAFFENGFILGWAVQTNNSQTVLIVASFNTNRVKIFPLQHNYKDFGTKDLNIFSTEIIDVNGLHHIMFYVSAAQWKVGMENQRDGTVFVYTLEKEGLLVDSQNIPKLIKVVNTDSTSLNYFCPT